MENDNWCHRCGCGNDALGYAHLPACDRAGPPKPAAQALTDAEKEVLGTVRRYRGGVDFTGRGANRRRRDAAKALVDRGLLSGSERNAYLTVEGAKALEVAGLAPAPRLTDRQLG